jgi:tetratricopeptide (TPR) repeat protein
MREEAIRELQLAHKDQARSPFAANLLGRVYRREGRFDLAAAQFNRALELAPAEIADFARTVRFNLGTTYEASGALAKALKTYEGILQDDIDFGNLKHRIKYLKATSLKSMRSKPLVAVFSDHEKREIIALWGREARTGRGSRKEEVSLSFGQNYNTSGFDYFMKGMGKAALEEFQLAVQLDANFATALNNLGVTLAREGRFSEAKLRLEDAIHREPNSVVFRNNLGVIYFLLGKIDLARAELAKAYTIDPELTAVCLNFGDILYFKKEVRQAIDLYKRVGSFDVLAEIAEQRLMYKTPG